MKKILCLVLITAMAVGLSVPMAGAVGNDIFLCMHAESSMAYQSSNYGSLDYVQMKDSSGAIATATIIDGSTYLPFRYVAELAGLTDAQGGRMGQYTFMYEAIGDGAITVQGKESKVTRNVNVPFTYEMENGETIEYKIININGSLYFPMRYMASLVEAEVDYQGETGNVYFMSNEKVRKEFLNDDKSIKYKKLAAMKYYEFDNTLGYSDIYLKSDGETISSVTDDMHNNNTYYSVTRARKNLYFVDENYAVWTKKESEDSSSPIIFYTPKNERVDPKALTIITYQNKLYGIELRDEASGTGIIFKSDLDGENYEYISNCENVYNIILREHMDTGYLFYVDASTMKDIHRINLSTYEDVTLNITDITGGSLIEPVNIMSVDKNVIINAGLDSNKIDIIRLSDSIYESNNISGYLEKELTQINTAKKIEEVSSLNYDTDNHLLYFINNSGNSYGLYCYDIVGEKIYGINTSQNAKRRITIIKVSDNLYRIYHYSDIEKNVYKYELVSVSSDNSIKIGNNVIIKR